MPMITAEIFAPYDATLPATFAKILHINAVSHLHATADLLTIRVAFSPCQDEWYFNAARLNRATTPSFYVFAPIGPGVATDIEVTRFTVETRDQLKAEMVALYPSAQFPNLPDRTKVVVVAMV